MGPSGRVSALTAVKIAKLHNLCIDSGRCLSRNLAGGLFIDLPAGRAYMEDRRLELTAAEYRLLCLLVENEGRVLTRTQILDALWDGNGSFVDDNTLSVYVRRLREKLEEDPSAPAHLLTVRGRGYEWKGQRRG